MRWKTISIAGTYGDGKTLLSLGLVPRHRRTVMIFHGVHSWAQAVSGNKYATLGTMLAENGILPVLVETSRSTRNRRAWGDDMLGWVGAAFKDKTFEQELTDVTGAFRAVRSLYPRSPLSLWGFSLGGLYALLLAGGCGLNERPDIDGLILSGAGDQLRSERQDAMNLPILRDLFDNSALREWAAAAQPAWLHGFYGSQDESFDEAACRRVYDQITCADRTWQVIAGADHAFRRLDGRTSHIPLRIMVEAVTSRLT